jgi:hypothetical protein
MESTHERSGVTTGIAQLAALLREQLLQARRIYLRNRAPKSPYVHQLRRKVSAEQTRTFEILLAISFADIDDGIAPSIAAQPYLSVVAMIEERAQARALSRGEPMIGPDPLALVDRESAAQAAKDSAERAFIAAPMSPETLQRVLDADAAYHAVNERLVSVVRSRLARVQLQAV